MLSRTNGGCYIKPLCSHAYFFSRNRRPYRGVNLPGFLGETRKMILYIYIEREREAIFVGEVQSCHSGIAICDDESAKIVICDDHDGPQILLHRII